MVALSREIARIGLFEGCKYLVISIKTVIRSSLFATCLSVTIFLIDYYLRNDVNLLISGLFLSLTITPNALLIVFSGYLKGKGYSVKSALFTNGSGYYLVMLFMLPAYIFGVDSVIGVSIVYVLGIYLYTAIMLWKPLKLIFVWKKKSAIHREISIKKSANNMLISNLASSSVPVVTIWIASLIVDSEDLGIYKIFQQLISITGFGASVLMAIYGRYMSRYYASGELGDLTGVVVMISRSAALMLVSVLALSVIYIWVSGIQFDAISFLVWVLFFTVLSVNSIFGCAAGILNITDFENVVKINLVYFALVLLIAYSLCTWFYGLSGAIGSVSVVVSFQTIVLTVYVRKNVKIKFPAFSRA